MLNVFTRLFQSRLLQICCMEERVKLGKYAKLGKLCYSSLYKSQDEGYIIF